MPAPIDPARLARLQVVGAAVLFSTGGAAIKGTSYTGIRGGLEVASLRSGVAAAAIAAILPGSRRNWTRRTWIVGAAYAATVILFVLANKQTTSANAIFLQSTAPLYVLLAGVFLLHERVRGRRRACVMLVHHHRPDDGRVRARRTRWRRRRGPALGDVLALISGVTWAAHAARPALDRPRAGRHRAPRAGATVAGNLIAFVGLPALGAAALRRRPGLGADRLPRASSQIGLAYLLLTAAVRHVPAFEVSLLLLVEPALNPVWSWLVHGETPSGGRDRRRAC